MDRMQAFVLVHHAIVERTRMSIKLRGLTAAIDKLHHDLDAQAEKLMTRVATTQDRGATVFAQVHKRLDGAAKDLDDVNNLLSDLENTNGGPSLDDSSGSSELQQPAASWSAT